MVTITSYGSQRILPDDSSVESRRSFANGNDYRSWKRIDPERRAGSNTERLATVGANGRGTQTADTCRSERAWIADSMEVKRG